MAKYFSKAARKARSDKWLTDFAAAHTALAPARAKMAEARDEVATIRAALR